ncbi:MAG: CPBP family intramembrane metalloprotease [Spirochaetales bacterium]|nr:CPBP family intramembrane metalloprotease [Spirochaetales bacterium]
MRFFTPRTAFHSRKTRELAVLFALFVIPGATAPASLVEFAGHLRPLLALALRNGAFFLLVQYLLDIEEERTFATQAGSRSRTPTGTIGTTVLVWTTLLMISLLVAFIAERAGIIDGASREEVGTILHILNNRYSALLWIPILVVTLLTVGYVEELFFRTYMIFRFRQLGLNRSKTVVLSALLFSAGHGYQGAVALFFAFVAGLILGSLWYRRPHLHAFAVGHTLYNVTALVISAA